MNRLRRHPSRRIRPLATVTLIWLSALVAVMAVAQAATAGLSTRVSVKPGSGSPRTRFTLTFRVPQATGTFGSIIRTDTLSVSGPRHDGCVSGTAMTLRSAKRGARAMVTLTPGPVRRGGWCAGQFSGKVVQSEAVRCAPGPAIACPDLVIAPQVIARFRFRVTTAGTVRPPAPGGSPSTDRPSFGGLISANSCEPLFRPEILPNSNVYTLAWDAATDPVTPSSAIVYEIFLATTPGGEDYAKPTWTTSPGVTSFVTPGLPEGAVYFVVRARDAAGHEDGNTAERQGVNACGAPRS
jgi:hypothetical protein